MDAENQVPLKSTGTFIQAMCTPGRRRDATTMFDTTEGALRQISL